MAKANELRTGMALNMDGKLWVVLKMEHTKPGKGPAYLQVKLRAIDGGVQEKRMQGSDVVDIAMLDRRTMEFLYPDGSGGATFMDNEDFDQVEVGGDFLGDTLLYLEPNTSCTMLFYEGKPITIELPSSVELEVTDTTPQVKGATATNQLKEATCSTGLDIRVPPFIEVGERVKINTEDGSYIGRVKGD